MADRLWVALAESLGPTEAAHELDPAGWVSEFVEWPAGMGATPYQGEILGELTERGRVSVRSPHGAGKSATAALTVLWFALTRDGRDWKCVTTASAWRQLTHYLWPEIHKWARLLRWDRLGRPAFSQDELRVRELKLSTGIAFAAASNDHQKIEGAHADHLLFVFDEAKAIPDATWDAAEGAFSGRAETFGLAISTPGEPQGRFYQIQSRRKGYEDWHVRHVTKGEAVEAGRISARWADQRKRQWGGDSALYLNRVEGEFAASDEEGVIPLAWVEQAVDRWREVEGTDLGGLTVVGVDPARSGPDKTVLALRYGDVVGELRKFSKEGTTETTGRVKGLLELSGAQAVVDVVGIGAGVVDQLRDEKHLAKKILAFNASEKTTLKDRSGELGFVNCRSAAWWRMREILDPDNGSVIGLPPDDDLVGDLVAPHWHITAGGKIQVEGKDDIRKRIGRSTDVGDAVIQAFWADVAKSRLVLVGPVGVSKVNYWSEVG